MLRTIRIPANSKIKVIINTQKNTQKLSENDLKIIKYANNMLRNDDQEIKNDLERQKREKQITKQNYTKETSLKRSD